jgi:hypothetical protein
MVNMDKKNLYLTEIIIFTAISLIGTIIIYILNIGAIIRGIEILNTFPGILNNAWSMIIIILIRIILLAGMSIYMFKEWFNQEHQYLSDLPFLFALFFLILIFGKAFDLLYNLLYYSTDELTFSIIYKIRLSIGVLDLSPMYYLSIGMIIFFLTLSGKHKKLENKEYSKKIQLLLFLLIVVIELIIIILFLTVKTAVIILPSIVIPSIITIVVIFYLAYKNERLSQVNPLILSVGFGAYLLSQIIRPVFHTIIGQTPLTISISEIIDLIIFLVIFLGLIRKIEY